MHHTVVDKWDSIPSFVLNNDKLAFNGIFIPKGACLDDYRDGFISFGSRTAETPKILLRSLSWNLYALAFNIQAYEETIPQLSFSSCKLEFVDFNEKYTSKSYREGIVLGTPEHNVPVKGFEIYFLKEKGKHNYTDYDHHGEMPATLAYDIDVDCAIMTLLHNEKCIYFRPCIDSWSLLFGEEESLKKHDSFYPRTNWIEFPHTKDWKTRTFFS